MNESEDGAGALGPVKTCTVMVHLFGKPAWEMDLENVEVDQDMIETIERLGGELQTRLGRASEILRILTGGGWTGEGGLYDVMLYKDQGLEETERELVRHGINPSEVTIEEETEEENG